MNIFFILPKCYELLQPKVPSNIFRQSFLWRINTNKTNCLLS